MWAMVVAVKAAFDCLWSSTGNFCSITSNQMLAKLVSPELGNTDISDFLPDVVDDKFEALQESKTNLFSTSQRRRFVSRFAKQPTAISN